TWVCPRLIANGIDTTLDTSRFRFRTKTWWRLDRAESELLGCPVPCSVPVAEARISMDPAESARKVHTNSLDAPGTRSSEAGSGPESRVIDPLPIDSIGEGAIEVMVAEPTFLTRMRAVTCWPTVLTAGERSSDASRTE